MRYNMQITVILNQQGGSHAITDHLDVRDLSLFQICVILGGLQNLIEMEQDKAEV